MSAVEKLTLGSLQLFHLKGFLFNYDIHVFVFIATVELALQILSVGESLIVNK